ncbi:glycosyltransferase family 2 protein [Tenacibaculum retecalamus]|uniref:glycosyltransferase family 2 protein n=1 Tax=Tenacibaculum retecalamus TaxID=3018315 RepID=UPI0023D9086A|nr:glycosyltransferase family A protein [Tenacibaculum retecalamus]WBX70730.1 glycosyltransferase family A protein [Tenacibaculum retecalamus]
MKTLTVFTPTYNRAYCLHQVYDSLCKQTSTDFIWLIIDDGSSDNTKELVDLWSQENKIIIEYVYQNNLGMHGGYNTAYANINTELNVCIDSDDYMTDDAVEKIIDFWLKNGDDKYAGIVGLDALKNGEILGEKFPKSIKSSSLEDLYYKHKVPGDKKLIFRTEVVKKYPKYPIFKEEKFVPLGSLFLQIDKDYELLCMNEVLCIVEYLDDGSTRNIFKQYVRHPKGFRFARTIEVKYSKYFKIRFKALIHFISSSIMLKDYRFFKKRESNIINIIGSTFGRYVIFLYKK